MDESECEYARPWRPMPRHLWWVAIASWVLGIVLEPNFQGAFSASSGVALAATSPMFVFALAKQQTYETDLRLAILNLRKENGMGVEMAAMSPNFRTEPVYDGIAKNEAKMDEFVSSFGAHRRFTRSLMFAQAYIVSLAALVGAFGTWIANFAFHCKGEIAC